MSSQSVLRLQDNWMKCNTVLCNVMQYEFDATHVEMQSN